MAKYQVVWILADHQMMMRCLGTIGQTRVPILNITATKSPLCYVYFSLMVYNSLPGVFGAKHKYYNAFINSLSIYGHVVYI